MNLSHALRLDEKNASFQTVSLVGAGGKTTALFQLAKDLTRNGSSAVIVTATTHLGEWQVTLADRHIIATEHLPLKEFPSQGVTLITGEIAEGRTKPVDPITLNWLRAKCEIKGIPLLIEADGSRQKSLKAPAAHEPPIPGFSQTIIVVAGLGKLGKPLTDEYVHRAEIFSQLSGLAQGDLITPEALTRILSHPQGGLKNIPPNARRVVLLNQADTPASQSIGGDMAKELLTHFHSIIVGSLQQNNVQTFERTAGIILAAGKASRYGSPKQLLDWKGKPFVRHIAETALQAGLDPVVVVTGSFSTEIESALSGLPVIIAHNPNYEQGQSTSVHAGINKLPHNVGGAVFLLSDQPQIPVEVIRALSENHTRKMNPIHAPLVLGEKRANPVLFDRVTFADLLAITGDTGGRAIFSKHKVEYLPWHDDRLLLDVDKPEDYQRLVEDETL